MKKLLTLFLALAASVGTMFADGTKIGDLYYNLNVTKQTAEVTYELYWDANNYQSLTTANISASVTYRGTTYSVTSIGNSAFYNCSSLTSIYVPCGEMERFKQMLNNDSRINDHASLPYTITTIAENGNVTTSDITTLTICEPFITCTATPDYGYHFVKWSDGNTDNPR